jgi:hypothetical protein
MWPFSKHKSKNKQQLVSSPRAAIPIEELAEKLISEADDFLSNSSLSNFDSHTQRAGADFAARLRSMAIELSHDRQTEFSSDIPKLHLLAAEIAYISLWGLPTEMEVYERDIFYYRAFPSSVSMVAEYENFKSAFKYSGS